MVNWPGENLPMSRATVVIHALGRLKTAAAPSHMLHIQYHDAFRVFYKNWFEFNGEPRTTIAFLQDLPKGALGLIQHVKFKFGEGDIGGWAAKDIKSQWIELLTFVKDHLDLPNLSVLIDTSDYSFAACENDILDQDAEDDDPNYSANRDLYDAQHDIGTATAELLPGVRNVTFHFAWYKALEYLFTKAVMGERYHCDPRGTLSPQVIWREVVELPHWHEPAEEREFAKQLFKEL